MRAVRESSQFGVATVYSIVDELRKQVAQKIAQMEADDV